MRSATSTWSVRTLSFMVVRLAPMALTVFTNSSNVSFNTDSVAAVGIIGELQSSPSGRDAARPPPERKEVNLMQGSKEAHGMNRLCNPCGSSVEFLTSETPHGPVDNGG